VTVLEKMPDAKRHKEKKVPSHAMHRAELLRLKRIQGQVEGIEKMISDGRYCPDILLQVKAVISALQSVELSIMERHIRHCLSKALESGNKKETNLKIDEIITLVGRKSF
jgi:DNA-binding FrmR family transcriptional regulator